MTCADCAAQVLRAQAADASRVPPPVPDPPPSYALPGQLRCLARAAWFYRVAVVMHPDTAAAVRDLPAARRLGEIVIDSAVPAGVALLERPA
jgi:hypothetical protein